MQTDATAVVNDANSDFAAEASVSKSLVDKLSTSVKQLSSPPTASQLAALPAEVSSVSTATKNLMSAASPKCS